MLQNRKEELLTHVTSWANPTDVTLNERRPTPISYVIYMTMKDRQNQPVVREVRMKIPSWEVHSWGRGAREPSGVLEVFCVMIWERPPGVCM